MVAGQCGLRHGGSVGELEAAIWRALTSRKPNCLQAACYAMLLGVGRPSSVGFKKPMSMTSVSPVLLGQLGHGSVAAVLTATAYTSIIFAAT